MTNHSNKTAPIKHKISQSALSWSPPDDTALLIDNKVYPSASLQTPAATAMVPNLLDIILTSTNIRESKANAVAAIAVAMNKKKPTNFISGSANSLYIKTETPALTAKGIATPVHC